MRPKTTLCTLVLCLILTGFLGTSERSEFERSSPAYARAPGTGERLPALDEEWPKEIVGPQGSVLLYQPQVERFDGNVLEARAAVSVKTKANEGAPVFGAIWIVARVDTDREARMVYIRDIEVSEVRFADATEAQQEQFATFLEDSIRGADLSISLDRLLADLDLDETAMEGAGLKHDPPHIMLSTEPAVLVLIDGEPILQKIEGTDLQYVANTPFLIAERSKVFYLSGGGDLWYRSNDPLGPWVVTTQVPSEVAGLLQKEEDEPTDASQDGPPPKIIIATEPTELVVSDGDPSWSPVEGMDLLYMDNTDSDVFLELSTQMYYVQLSGRWYRGASTGEVWQWENVPNDELPKAFSDIEEGSVNGHVLVHVGGTEQAREAVLDNTIPQTTAINRNDTSLEVTYDGTPQFVDVEEATTVQYAQNTASSVFKVGNHYYVCEQGVWYASSSPTGPWIVATSVPSVIYDIPPSNPHHNVTYVQVYDVTPTVVYVGYTPGYMGSYYYHGAVVYGTGWYYQPWYGSVYYPRPPTWGLHVGYNPWTGWGVGISYSTGPFTFVFGTWGHGSHHHHHHGWFGAGGYHHYNRAYVGGGYRKTTINIDNVNINRGNVQIGDRTVNRNRNNIYQRSENRTRNVERPRTGQRTQPRVATNRPNNVLTDRDGNVYRRNDDGKWQKRDGGAWKQDRTLDRPSASTRDTARPSRDAGAVRDRPSPSRDRSPVTRTTPQTRSSTRSATRPQLERDQRARQRGAQRTRQSPQRGGGGARGGRRR